MSTKIYNGYKLASRPLFLHEINELLNPARQAMEKVALETLARTYLAQAFKIMDWHIVKNHGIEVSEFEGMPQYDWQTPLSTGQFHVTDAITKDIKEQGQSYLDPESSVCVYTDRESTYALLFSAGREATAAFEKATGAQEFNYWNNTDAPDDIPYEEFRARGDVWDELLGRSGIPSSLGATFSLVNRSIMFLPIDSLLDKEAFDKEISEGMAPDFDRRVHTMALLTPAGMLPPNVRDELANTNSLSPAVSYLRSLEKGEVPAFNEMKNYLATILPRNYTLGQLRTQKSDIPTLDIFKSSPRRPKP